MNNPAASGPGISKPHRFSSQQAAGNLPQEIKNLTDQKNTKLFGYRFRGIHSLIIGRTRTLISVQTTSSLA